MKKLLLGMLVLGSFSTFANDFQNCSEQTADAFEHDKDRVEQLLVDGRCKLESNDRNSYKASCKSLGSEVTVTKTFKCIRGNRNLGIQPVFSYKNMNINY